VTTPSQIIALLHSLNFGDLDAIRAKLDEATGACGALGREELTGILGEAQAALATGDLKTFRKRIETAVSRLGHLR
jgi:hypothetical protein